MSTSPTVKCFKLPANASAAQQTWYGIMTGGIFSVPMVFSVYHAFIEPQITLEIREFFFLFTFIYIFIFNVCSHFSNKATSTIREKLGGNPSRDISVIAPLAASSNNPEITLMRKKYWILQLFQAYLSGMFFSWVGCIFVLFVI